MTQSELLRRTHSAGSGKEQIEKLFQLAKEEVTRAETAKIKREWHLKSWIFTQVKKFKLVSFPHYSWLSLDLASRRKYENLIFNLQIRITF